MDGNTKVMGVNDPYLKITEDGIVYLGSGRRDMHSMHKYPLKSLPFQEVLFVLDHFERHQPKAKYIRMWELPALSRYIRVHIFNETISRYRARQLAIMCFELSKRSGICL